MAIEPPNKPSYSTNCLLTGKTTPYGHNKPSQAYPYLLLYKLSTYCLNNYYTNYKTTTKITKTITQKKYSKKATPTNAKQQSNILYHEPYSPEPPKNHNPIP